MGDGGGGTGVEISEQQVDANLVLVPYLLLFVTRHMFTQTAGVLGVRTRLLLRLVLLMRYREYR